MIVCFSAVVFLEVTLFASFEEFIEEEVPQRQRLVLPPEARRPSHRVSQGRSGKYHTAEYSAPYALITRRFY